MKYYQNVRNVLTLQLKSRLLKDTKKEKVEGMKYQNI